MAKAIFAAVLLLALTVLATAGGRGNVVRHVNPRTGEVDEIITSAGSCRHHLSAHPDDRLITVNGELTNPEACN